MQKIKPFLWFDTQAEEAMNFYVGIFKDSKAGFVSRYGDAGPGPKGTAMVATFSLAAQEFMAINGGQSISPQAPSFYVDCDTQEEVDDLWEKLSADGGSKGQCGWLKDKFGVSWNIVPTILGKLMGDPDPAKSQRVMQAMLKMTKLDIAALQKAYDGE